MPLLVVSIWSRDWIGWWCLVPVVVSLVFMMVNPLLFPKPRSTRNRASKAVFGERIWSQRLAVPVPEQFTTRVLNATYAIRSFGAAALAYGLVRLDLVATLTGVVILQTAFGDNHSPPTRGRAT